MSESETTNNGSKPPTPGESKGNGTNSTNDKENPITKFLFARPVIPLILGTVFLIVARVVNAAAADVNVWDLWPEWVYGFTLIVVGIVLMFKNGLGKPKDAFLKDYSDSVKKVMRLAPLVASVVLFYIASTVARASDDVEWSEVTFELVISLLLFALGVFFLIYI